MEDDDDGNDGKCWIWLEFSKLDLLFLENCTFHKVLF